MYSYFHSLGNWNLVWLFGSTGVGESVADILHFVPLMGANIKHQDGTGTALKVTHTLRCHLILNCKRMRKLSL